MKTELYSEHVLLGAKMVDFAGWDMPIQYTGVIEEHQACRTTGGLFDVSHMGEFLIQGPGSEAFLDFVITNQVSGLPEKKALYTVTCRPNAGIVDDLIVYKKSSTDFLAIVNASNIEKDFNHFKEYSDRFDVKLSNVSNHYSLIALQGPLAEKIAVQVLSAQLTNLKIFFFLETSHPQHGKLFITRTGYTGEDGFEILCENNKAVGLWKSLLEVGTPLGLKPCGLAARDTLRIEMKYPLYGHELDETTHPLEAELSWVVKMSKTDFVGKSALLKIQNEPPVRALIGLVLTEPGIARDGASVLDPQNKRKIGRVTSGTYSPSLKKSIAIAYVDAAFSALDTLVSLEVRGKVIAAKVTKTPFYNRKARS